MVLAVIDMVRVVREAGLLAYPLLLASMIAVGIIVERAYALRSSAVVPRELADAILQGRASSSGKYASLGLSSGSSSTLGRVVDFTELHPGDDDGAKAYARLEIMKMERGVSYLDVIYTGAPLIGLIGTVTGLLAAFSVIDPDTKMPDPVKFTESVGYALSATLLGLCVAVIALIGNGYLQRRIDKHAAQLDVLLERVLVRHNSPDGQK